MSVAHPHGSVSSSRIPPVVFQAAGGISIGAVLLVLAVMFMPRTTTAPSTTNQVVFDQPVGSNSQYFPAIQAAITMMNNVRWGDADTAAFDAATQYMSSEFAKSLALLSPSDFLTGGTSKFGLDKFSGRSRTQDSKVVGGLVWVPYDVYRTADPHTVLEVLYIIVDPATNKVVDRRYEQS
ncbi:MAG: hypothetical protein WC773_03665 [Patescibacteria group bacterium]|jgi:hypothetical protein